MSYTTIAGLLLDGYPEKRKSQGSEGSTFKYRGDLATLVSNEPAIGEAWADSIPVSGTNLYQLGRSDWGELIVETEISTGPGETISTTLDDTHYENIWRPADLPLELHPAFIAGGASDLFAVASGTPTRKHIADVYGWENELDPILKSAYQYKRLKSDGSTDTTITLTGGALAFAKLRTLGFPTFPTRLPTWSKVGTYSGTNAPGVGTIGQYTATPDGSGYPEGYQWVKVTDDARRVGRKPKWERTEAWEGYVKVWLDIDTLNPAGNTLPS